MRITSDMLRDLGCKNVIGVDNPVTLINGVAIVSKPYEFESLEEIQHTEWFTDAKAGAILIICDSPLPTDVPDCPKVVLRAFEVRDFNNHAQDFGDCEKFSLLWLFRNRDRLAQQ